MPGVYYFAVLSKNNTYSATSEYTVNFTKVHELSSDTSAKVIGICQEAGIVFQTNSTGSVYYNLWIASVHCKFPTISIDFKSRSPATVNTRTIFFLIIRKHRLSVFIPLNLHQMCMTVWIIERISLYLCFCVCMGVTISFPSSSIRTILLWHDCNIQAFPGLYCYAHLTR